MPDFVEPKSNACDETTILSQPLRKPTAGVRDIEAWALLAARHEGSGSPFRWTPPDAAQMAALLPQYDGWELLGCGGMGAVYKARQNSLDRLVAIKVLPPDIADDEGRFADRFKKEACIMAQLDHPHIVPVYDSGQTSADGLLYYVMAFVDGTDVSKMLESQEPLPPQRAATIAACVCDALDFAHSHGVIHRDIKPANVLINAAGTVKVADFGLAKRVDGSGTELTLSNTALGTAHFAAPETYLCGVTVDHRADIYSLGVMLYQMLTGKIPRGMAMPPSKVVPGLDSRFDAIVRTAMQEDREKRYQSAQAFRQALAPLMGAGDTTGPKRLGSAWIAKSGACVLGCMAAGSAWHFWDERSLPEKAALLAFDTGKVTTPVGISGDYGKSVAVQRDGKIGVDAADLRAVKPDLAERGAENPAMATKKTPFVNSLGMKLVPVPIVGGPTDKQRVLFSIWETRNQDYAVFITETNRAWNRENFHQGPVNPAAQMTWHDAQAFCQWLTERERKAGRIGSGHGYRLPTSHEWSCAVGIGDREDPAQTPAEKNQKIPNVFPWGIQWPPPSGAGNYMGEEHPPSDNPQTAIVGYRDSFVGTAPVGSFPADAFGLHDLGGNVWEWCEDWSDASSKSEIARGNSFADGDREHLLASRVSSRLPGRAFFNCGFRCVLAPVASGAAPASVAEAKLAASPDAPAFSSFVPGARWVKREVTVESHSTHQEYPYPEKLTDSAIRVRYRVLAEGKSYVDLILRRSSLRGYLPRYAVTFWSDARVQSYILIKDDPPGSYQRRIGLVAPRASVMPGGEHCLELYAIGERLTFFMDGRQMAAGSDSRLAEGYAAVAAMGPIEVISVETSDLRQ